MVGLHRERREMRLQDNIVRERFSLPIRLEIEQMQTGVTALEFYKFLGILESRESIYLSSYL